MDVDRYVDEKEAARLMSRGVQTLRNERAKGTGCDYVRIGRSIRYSVKTILAFMENHKVTPGGES